ncbi:gp208 [Sphingomonas phage PAU]|uniref:gp208 n=1 Tax=Sphingomonas phage PAU TaxID=1150991 RepID=UPI000257336E|nr:gp208 [Sphingomonas phage PAU]AFF28206.1 gp208 [Sphingomonas phage PAU]
MNTHDSQQKINILEKALYNQLYVHGTIQADTLVKLIPDRNTNETTAILFIESNNITKQNFSIAFRVTISNDYTTIITSDNRYNRNLIILDIDNTGTEKRNTETLNVMLSKLDNTLRTYRIQYSNTPLMLSGYNDFIDENGEKSLFPMFSERKFKLYASLNTVLHTIKKINIEHPNLKVTWI